MVVDMTTVAAVVALRIVDVDSYSIVGVYYRGFVDSADFHLTDRLKSGDLRRHHSVLTVAADYPAAVVAGERTEGVALFDSDTAYPSDNYQAFYVVVLICMFIIVWC